MTWPSDTVTAHKAQPLSDALLRWVDKDGEAGDLNAHNVLTDAIAQATKAETIEWLAALAERYGFKPPA